MTNSMAWLKFWDCTASAELHASANTMRPNPVKSSCWNTSNTHRGMASGHTDLKYSCMIRRKENCCMLKHLLLCATFSLKTTTQELKQVTKRFTLSVHRLAKFMEEASPARKNTGGHLQESVRTSLSVHF